MYTHIPHFKFLENIAQFYRDDRKKNIFCTFVSGIPLSFTTTAEHVGIIRSTTSGNAPHVLQRIAAHKRSLGAVLSAGLAKRHRGNHAASLHTEKLYGLLVLMSGLGSLYLLESDKKTLGQHYKDTLQNLQKLYSRTPESFVFSWWVSTFPRSSSCPATFNLWNDMQTSRKHP